MTTYTKRREQEKSQRAPLIQGLRARLMVFDELPDNTQRAIDQERLIPVKETHALLERALAGDMLFPPEHADLSTWEIPYGRKIL